MVCNAKYNSIREPATPIVYVPLREINREMGATLEIRANGDAMVLAAVLRSSIEQLDPSIQVTNVLL